MNKVFDLQDFKEQLFTYGEAIVDHYTHRTVDEEDVGIDFLLQHMDDDEFCTEMLRAILGDSDSAKYIARCLDKHMLDMYHNERM